MFCHQYTVVLAPTPATQYTVVLAPTPATSRELTAALYNCDVASVKPAQRDSIFFVVCVCTYILISPWCVCVCVCSTWKIHAVATSAMSRYQTRVLVSCPDQATLACGLGSRQTLPLAEFCLIPRQSVELVSVPKHIHVP